MTANIEDYTTFEIEKPDRLTVKVNANVDFKGFADEVCAELDEQLAHEIATRYGYVKERTCRIAELKNSSDYDWRCNSCEECFSTCTYLPSFCPNCGARSVHDHARWAGEEIARLRFENDKLNEDIDYLKDQLAILKAENAALRKKFAKAVEE